MAVELRSGISVPENHYKKQICFRRIYVSALKFA